MEPLRDPDVAEQHRHVQRQRGAYHPDELPDLLAYDEDKPRRRSAARSSVRGDRERAQRTDDDPPEDENGQTRLEDLGA
jgi:hypothetical protein